MLCPAVLCPDVLSTVGTTTGWLGLPPSSLCACDVCPGGSAIGSALSAAEIGRGVLTRLRTAAAATALGGRGEGPRGPAAGDSSSATRAAELDKTLPSVLS